MALNNFLELSLEEKLRKKIFTYIETIWRDAVDGQKLNDWESNFKNADLDVQKKEMVNMLYLLSKFTYLGKREIRLLLKCLYRDLYKYPIVEKIRMDNDHCLDRRLIEEEFIKELNLTNFVSVGGGSESGAHLLLPFRQENEIVKSSQCKAQEEIYMIREVHDYKHIIIKDEKIKRYIFIDDFIGSGQQVIDRLEEPINLLREKIADVEVNYYSLIAVEDGLKRVQDKGIFNSVESVYELDLSFKTFNDNSRYYQETITDIDSDFAKSTAETYGEKLFYHALGYNDCQLMLGFEHNTPDNSLPVFWSEENDWSPIFKRYTKK